jgi:lipoate---protein ligase
MILEHVMSRFPGSGYYVLTREDIKEINDLKTKKYATWEWIYGYSPEYELENTIIANSRKMILRITVSGGIIIKATIIGGLQGDHALNDLEKALEGVRHDEHDLMAKLGSYTFPEGFLPSTPEEFIRKYLF